MTRQANSRGRSHAKKWYGAVALLTPVMFLASIPWLKNQPDPIVLLLAGIAAAITIACSFGLAVIEDGELDEWNRAAARFSNQWGWLAGGGLIAIMLALPPVQAAIRAASGALAGVTHPDMKLVLMAFGLGFMAVMLAQTVCILALSAIWRARMSRPE